MTFLVLNVVAFFELVDSSGCIDHSFTTCEERVTFVADIYSKTWFCTFCNEAVPASTSYCTFVEFRMKTFFHFAYLL